LDDGTVLGSVIGGQVLPEHPDEDKFRATARELDIDENRYIEALNKVSVKTKDEINAAAGLLGDVINMFVRSSYLLSKDEGIVGGIKENIEKATAQKFLKFFKKPLDKWAKMCYNIYTK